MIRSESDEGMKRIRLPRMRGDDPTNKLIGLGADLFAPHARG